MKTFVTAAWLSAQLRAPVGRVLKALRCVGAEPIMTLNDTVYYDAELASSAQLILFTCHEDTGDPQAAFTPLESGGPLNE
jgi:hypothetical protein